MRLILRLLITADWPARSTDCEWVLTNAAGQALQRGCSEPRHWPAAERCEVILDAAQTLLLQAQLPKGARARSQEVIAYALEDQLLGEAEAEHFVVGAAVDRPAAEGAALLAATPVWVVARARLRSLLAALRGVERTAESLISEIQLAPLDGNWSVCLRATAQLSWQGCVRTGAEAGFSCSLDALRSPPLELRLAVQAAQKAGMAPSRIVVYAPASADFDAPAWQAALGIPVIHAGEYAWQDWNFAGARNLLTGEFAPPRRAQDGWGSVKPALWLAALTLLVYAGYSLGEWFWLEQQSRSLRQQMQNDFRAAAPQTSAIVDAPLQMQRLHDQLRRERGQLGATDFLPLLAAVSEIVAGQGMLRSLGYEDGRLELTVQVANAQAAENLRSLLQRRALNVTLRDTRAAGGAGGGLDAVFAVRGQP